MINNSPQVKKFIYVMGFTSIILGTLCIISVLVYVYFIREPVYSTCENWLENTIRPLSYTAVIQDIEEDSCRIKIVTMQKEEIVLCMCNSSKQNAHFKVGDTLKKPLSKIILTRYNQASQSTDYFDYPCCK